MAKDIGSLIKDVNFIFKLIEVILCCVSTALMSDESILIFADLMAMNTTFVAIIGYLIICLCMLVAIVLEDESKMLPVLLLVVGAVLNLAVGILYIERYVFYKNHGQGVTELIVIGCLQLICAIIMAVDVFFTLKE